MVQEDTIYSLKEASTMLALDESELQNYIEAKQLRARKTRGAYTVTLSDLWGLVYELEKGALVDFYETVLRCSNKERDCPKTRKTPRKVYFQKGFYTEGEPGKISYMVVAKNPGHPLEAEMNLYWGSNRDMAKTHLYFVRRIFYDPFVKEGEKQKSNFSGSDRRSLVFHKNLLRYMCWLMDVPESHPDKVKRVFEKTLYTNLVKCPTHIESGEVLDSVTMDNCFRKHFLREIDLFSPKVVIALGREVYNFLRIGRINIPVVFIKHPSRNFYGPIGSEKETYELKKMKNEIDALL